MNSADVIRIREGHSIFHTQFPYFNRDSEECIRKVMRNQRSKSAKLSHIHNPSLAPHKKVLSSCWMNEDTLYIGCKDNKASNDAVSTVNTYHIGTTTSNHQETGVWALDVHPHLSLVASNSENGNGLVVFDTFNHAPIATLVVRKSNAIFYGSHFIWNLLGEANKVIVHLTIYSYQGHEYPCYACNWIHKEGGYGRSCVLASISKKDCSLNWWNLSQDLKAIPDILYPSFTFSSRLVFDEFRSMVDIPEFNQLAITGMNGALYFVDTETGLLLRRNKLKSLEKMKETASVNHSFSNISDSQNSAYEQPTQTDPMISDGMESEQAQLSLEPTDASQSDTMQQNQSIDSNTSHSIIRNLIDPSRERINPLQTPFWNHFLNYHSDWRPSHFLSTHWHSNKNIVITGADYLIGVDPRVEGQACFNWIEDSWTSYRSITSDGGHLVTCSSNFGWISHFDLRKGQLLENEYGGRLFAVSDGKALPSDSTPGLTRHSAFTLSYDPSGTQLFVGGGPSFQTVNDHCYGAIWRN